MIDRILDIAATPARLSVSNSLLVVEVGNSKETVPLHNLGAVVVSCPGVTYTQAVLAGLAGAGVPFICCDARHQPVGMLLPLTDNSVQAERFRRQADLNLPTRKRLWQQLVRAKVLAQAAAVRRLGGDGTRLAALAGRVRSGDPDNVEAQAARLYWPLCFGSDFTRDRDSGGVNARLNYGYAILRAMVGRAVCGAGLHPSLGLHHHNRYDAFCLASDMMEPFRPLVDTVVAGMEPCGPGAELDGAAKRALLEGVCGRFAVEEEARTLWDIVTRACSSLAGVVGGARRGLWLPPVEPLCGCGPQMDGLDDDGDAA
ncbi:type II CRISPR-associated endonuclease Cas1 [Nitratidesulfovibrio termitidis]|uniref:type II CRISPR-associated endonuclease Cas1 n=1 Tax=Nitratidesulfovibrio termitidis TaxID=42252 RepID=UPI00042A4E9E|nr:type II CRISPR-associated endonuclease Cas1 [Nitratidesulfovibrio termitidis]